MKKRKAAVILVLILAALAGLAYYASLILSDTGAGADMSISLGLDLSGGVSITYEVVDDNPSQEDMDDTIYKLQKRVESYSTESSVYQVGDDRITVEIPGIQDANTVLKDLGSPGSLYFIAQTDSDGNTNYSYDSASGAYVLNYDIEDLIENGSVIMDGTGVKEASAAYQQDSTTGSKDAVVELTLNDDAAEAFGEATTSAAETKASIGIYYDGEFISVPTVQSAITDGNCVITGMSSYDEADALATQIRIGSLSLELSELESSVVGAQLGGQAISSSLKAGAIGLVIVMVFMIAMYALPGVAAAIALGVYTTLVIATLYWFEITLTLPGIAGIILGIGMAVDANVIVFARIREEISAGRTVQTAIKTGFQKAASAIVDGNITTFIAAIVLMMLGSGTVKGFAYTLMISIIISMFTAMVVTRWLLNSLYALGFRSEKLYGSAKEKKSINFIGHRAVFFGISLAIIAAGFIGMAVYRTNTGSALNYGLDFVGGASTTVDMGTDMTIEEIESDVIPLVEEITGDTNVQANKVEGTTQITIKTRTLDLDERDELNTMLADNFGVDETTITSQSISSTISGEMRTDAVKAVLVSCLCMLVYIWFRFKDLRFATSAILALLHDVLVVITVYALVRISVGSTFIACVLTIVGYSINDTIVIFDRIRENLSGLRKTQTREELAEIANRSMTQTISRSLNTSITTFVMVMMLYLLGVSSIRDFALPLMAGLVSGTYSSICIATELWYEMKIHVGKKERKN